MFKRLKNSENVTISVASKNAIDLVTDLLQTNPEPTIAEIGIGVGATTAALCSLLKGRGKFHLFDYADRLDILFQEIKEAGFADNIILHANGRKTFDSYNWSLAKMLRDARRTGDSHIFDFVYLDGAHAFQYDAPASILLKEMLKPGGVLLFDYYMWTFSSSPTLNPKVNKVTAQNYTEEQTSVSHIALVCELFFDGDKNFEIVPLNQSIDLRRAYRKIA